jgi:hypothetical protein
MTSLFVEIITTRVAMIGTEKIMTACEGVRKVLDEDQREEGPAKIAVALNEVMQVSLTGRVS